MMPRFSDSIASVCSFLLKASTAIGMVLLVLAAGCGDENDLSVARGRQLEFIAETPRIANKVVFTDGLGRTRLIRPKASNRQLAVVELIVVNRSVTVVSALVNEAAAQLGDRRSDRLEAIDPFNADVVDGEVDERGAIVLDDPPLWGEVELNKGFQMEGWFVFDVPKGLILGTLWWNQADTVSLDFIDYQR